MIRVALVEDEALVRAGLVNLLRLAPDMAVVGEACDGVEGLALVASAAPDVVLLDLRLPRKGGLEVLRELQARERRPACLVLTTFDDQEAALEAIQAGARGYLRKDVSLERLLAAVRALAAGGTFLEPAFTETALRGLSALRAASPRRDEDAFPPDPLTPRELEVLRLLASGYSNREVSLALGTAEGTIKIHVSSILLKLGARDRIRAVLRALELGIL
jgi:DNA-binding NarL/FixJ family response regulator